MSSNGTKPVAEMLRDVEIEELLAKRLQRDRQENRGKRIARIGRLWESRRVLLKFAAWGAVLTAVIAILIPSQYESATRLMPPDPPQGQGLAMLAGIVGKMGGSLGALGGDLLGMKTSGDLFATVLTSRTVQDDLVDKFDLRRVYGVKRWVDARKELTNRTDISIDHKSGVLTIHVAGPRSAASAGNRAGIRGAAEQCGDAAEYVIGAPRTRVSGGAAWAGEGGAGVGGEGVQPICEQ